MHTQKVSSSHASIGRTAPDHLRLPQYMIKNARLHAFCGWLTKMGASEILVPTHLIVREKNRWARSSQRRWSRFRLGCTFDAALCSPTKGLGCELLLTPRGGARLALKLAVVAVGLSMLSSKGHCVFGMVVSSGCNFLPCSSLDPFGKRSVLFFLRPRLGQMNQHISSKRL